MTAAEGKYNPVRAVTEQYCHNCSLAFSAPAPYYISLPWNVRSFSGPKISEQKFFCNRSYDETIDAIELNLVSFFFFFFFLSKIEFFVRTKKKKKKKANLQVKWEIIREMYSKKLRIKYTFNVPVSRMALFSRDPFDVLVRHIDAKGLISPSPLVV